MTVAVALAVVALAASTVLTRQANQGLQQSLERERNTLERERRARDGERLTAYFQRIALAERKWSANNLSSMERLLSDCPQDLRGWEWRYLKRLRYGALPPLRHDSPVYSVAFSSDGQYLATATKEGVVRLWGAKTGQELRKWHAHEGDATCLKFSPAGQNLASGGWDAMVKVWDVEKVLRTEVNEPVLLLKHTGRVWSFAFRPTDGQRLASAGRTPDGKGEVKVWDMRSGREVSQLSNGTGFFCVQFSPDGRRLASGSADSTVRIWDWTTGEVLRVLQPNQTARVESVAFSRDGKQLASAGLDRTVKVWDTQNWNLLYERHDPTGAVHCVAFDGDRRLVWGSTDGTVKVWDGPGTEPHVLRGHTSLGPGRRRQPR